MTDFSVSSFDGALRVDEGCLVLYPFHLTPRGAQFREVPIMAILYVIHPPESTAVEQYNY